MKMMPDTNKIQWRDGKNQGRVGIDKGGTKAALGRRPDAFYIEYLDGMIVLTDPEDPGYQRQVSNDA